MPGFRIQNMRIRLSGLWKRHFVEKLFLMRRGRISHIMCLKELPFLRRAVTEEEGIKHADCYIQNITGIDDNTIVEIIRQLIIQKYIAYQGESDIAKRYVEYSEKIR